MRNKLLKTANLQRRILALLLAVLMIVGLMPIYAEGSLTPAATGDVSEPALRAIVTAKINALADSTVSAGLDSIIEGINNLITQQVTDAIMGLLTNDAIKNLAGPALEAAIQGILNQYGITLPAGTDIGSFIDDLLGNQVVEDLLNSAIVKEIIARTVQYAVADVMDDIALPTTSETIANRKQELINEFTADIFGSPEKPVDLLNSGGPKVKISRILPSAGTSALTPTVNLSFIDFTVTAWNKILSRNFSVKTINVNGWHVGNIGSYIDLNLAIGQFGEFGEVKPPSLSDIDFEEVMLNALKRAAKDVINEKIAEFKAELKDEIEAAIARADQHMVDKLNDIFEELGLDVVVTTEDTPEQIKAKIEDALLEIKEEHRQAVRDALAAKCAAIKFDIEVKYMPVVIAKVNRIVDCINDIRIIRKAEVAVNLNGNPTIIVPALGEDPITATYNTMGKYRYEYLKLLPIPPQWTWISWTDDATKAPVLTNSLNGSGGAIDGVSWDPDSKQVTVAPAAKSGVFTLKSVYQHSIFKLKATENLTVTVQRAPSIPTRLEIVGEKDIIVPQGDLAAIEHYDVKVYDQYGDIMSGVMTQLSADIHEGTYLDSGNDLHVSKTAPHSYMYLTATLGLQPAIRNPGPSNILAPAYKIVYLHKVCGVTGDDVNNVLNGLEEGMEIGVPARMIPVSDTSLKPAGVSEKIMWMNWYEGWDPKFPGNQTVYVRYGTDTEIGRDATSALSKQDSGRPEPIEFAPTTPKAIPFTVLAPALNYTQPEAGRSLVTLTNTEDPTNSDPFILTEMFYRIQPSTTWIPYTGPFSIDTTSVVEGYTRVTIDMVPTDGDYYFMNFGVHDSNVALLEVPVIPITTIPPTTTTTTTIPQTTTTTIQQTTTFVEVPQITTTTTTVPQTTTIPPTTVSETVQTTTAPPTTAAVVIETVSPFPETIIIVEVTTVATTTEVVTTTQAPVVEPVTQPPTALPELTLDDENTPQGALDGNVEIKESVVPLGDATLPQTSEGFMYGFYILGIAIIGAGAFFVRRR